MSHLNKREKDTASINIIREGTWLNYYKDLWTNPVEKDNLYTGEVTMVDLITYDELEEILKSFKNKKTPGSYDMNEELIKYAPLEIKYRSLELLNICWKKYRIPKEWLERIIYPIFKKGNRHECRNYRRINLLNSAYKISTELLTKRINIINEALLIKEQCGFRRGRSCSIFILQQLIQKRREFNLPIYFLFIDYEKAFGTVTRGKLWKIMEKKGYPDHLIKVIQSLYKNTTL